VIEGIMLLQVAVAFEVKSGVYLTARACQVRRELPSRSLRRCSSRLSGAKRPIAHRALPAQAGHRR
jgi:hypothetical protein